MKKLSILIADDDPELADVFERIFIEKGYIVYKTDNGTDVIDQCKKFIPNIILMDIDMPGKDGWEVLKIIRKENKITPVIIMSNKYIEETDAMKSYSEGATFFMRKSLTLNEITASVDSLFKYTYSPDEILDFGKFILDMSSNSIQINSEKYVLKDRQIKLICMLAKRMNQVVSRGEILISIWHCDSPPNRQMLRNEITEINKKFSKTGVIQIKTVYNRGCYLVG